MILEIKPSDKAIKLKELLIAKAIKPEQYEEILLKFEKSPECTFEGLPSLMDLTFGDFTELVSFKTDDEMLTFFEEKAELKPSSTIADLLSRTLFLRNELKSVKKAFDYAKMPKLSELEEAAGFGRFNFGFFGIVDMLACRQGVADDVIVNSKLKNVIGKLTIIANKAKCEKMLTELIKSRKK